MSAVRHLTLMSADASRVASRDPHATADLVLDVALKEAAQLLARPDFTPAYNLARAAHVIQRAGESAGRLLGDRRADA